MRCLAPYALAGFLALAPCQSFAQAVMLHISSGTGFFVTREGMAITNEHVVKGCKQIGLVRNGKPAYSAQILATDSEADLALLQANSDVNEALPVRDESKPAMVNERVILVGYPGKAGARGQVITRQASITQTTGPQKEAKWIQLSDVIEQGNSGGPLFDGAGNVVGVIAAKAIVYRYNNNAPDDGVYSRSGIAISLPTLRDFLDAHGVRYQSSNAEAYLSAERITERVNESVFNVRCETGREVVQ